MILSVMIDMERSVRRAAANVLPYVILDRLHYLFD